MSKSLYSNNNPNTTIKGFGYKDEKTAIKTISLLKKINRNNNYKFNVINTMYNRAKFHKNQTKDMKKAMKIFKKWLINFKKNKKYINENIKYPYLKLNLIKKYEKLADYYNVSKVCRGLVKPKTSEKGFLVVFKEIKGNYKKLKNLNVYNNKKKLNINWNDKRDNQVKAKYNLMKKMKYKFFHNKGNLKGLPTKLHVNLIMWAYSPYPDILKKNIDLLKLI